MTARWFSVTAWFFFALSSLVGTIVGLFGAVAAAPQPGDGAPLEGVAYGIALAVTVVSAIVFILCLFLRPAARDFTPRNCLIAAGSCAMLFIVFWLSTHSGRYTLSIQVLDPDGNSLPNASVAYAGYPLGQGIGRMDRLANGDTVTDTTGTVTIRTNHAHQIHVDIRKEGFKRFSIILAGTGHRYPHQIISPSSGSGISVRIPADAFFDKQLGLLIPPHGDISLTATLEKE